MKIDQKTAKLICELEYLIGSECYNPNSYDGWNDIEGLDYRYPVRIRPNEETDEYAKIKEKISEDRLYSELYNGEFKEKNIRSMHYAFGSNRLYIGKGLINALEFLEDRYGLDFNELEKDRKEKGWAVKKTKITSKKTSKTPAVDDKVSHAASIKGETVDDIVKSKTLTLEEKIEKLIVDFKKSDDEIIALLTK